MTSLWECELTRYSRLMFYLNDFHEKIFKCVFEWVEKSHAPALRLTLPSQNVLLPFSSVQHILQVQKTGFTCDPDQDKAVAKYKLKKHSPASWYFGAKWSRFAFNHFSILAILFKDTLWLIMAWLFLFLILTILGLYRHIRYRLRPIPYSIICTRLGYPQCISVSSVILLELEVHHFLDFWLIVSWTL